MEDSAHQDPVPSNNQAMWVIVILVFLSLGICMLIGYLAYIGSIVFMVQRSNANATTTAETHATALAELGLVDEFDSNENGWKVGKQDDEFWAGRIKIENGVYVWNVEEFKNPFLNYSNFNNGPVVDDFDVSVDTKIINGDHGSCSGILFRESPNGWEYDGGYLISVCKDSQFLVGYLDAEGKWLTSSGWVTNPAIQRDNWNRIEIIARGSHFICKINDFVVYEMTDAHSAEGNIALFVEMHADAGNLQQTSLFLPEGEDPISAIFSFDHFSLQNR